MRVKCLTSNPQKDPLITSLLVPADFEAYLLPNTEKTFYRSRDYQYLEQVYYSRDCVMTFLDFKVLRSCFTQPIADVPMLALLYMLVASVRGELAGFGEVPMKQGHSYLLYLPGEAAHKAYLRKGHLKVMYCSFSQSYLDTMAAENKGIADLLELFNSGAPTSLIEKPARIGFNTLYQMWQVRSCSQSPAFRQALLMTRGRDLVLDYVSQANEPLNSVKRFVKDVLERSERIFKAKEIIDKTGKKRKIEDIATEVHLTERQLERGFKAAFQKPIGRYQIEVIIARVCNLLLSSNASVEEIAYEVGYSDLSSLSRIFRQATGMSPTEYKDNGTPPPKQSK